MYEKLEAARDWDLQYQVLMFLQLKIVSTLHISRHHCQDSFSTWQKKSIM